MKSSINRAGSRAFPVADINSDHYLVKLKFRKKEIAAETRLKFTLEKQIDPQVADLFEVTVAGKLAALHLLLENMDDFASTLHSQEEEETVCD